MKRWQAMRAIIVMSKKNVLNTLDAIEYLRILSNQPFLWDRLIDHIQKMRLNRLGY